jgi:hypothetical protein
MHMNRRSVEAAMLLVLAIGGCASSPPEPASEAVHVAHDFRAPAPLKDSRVIRLHISCDRGTLYFVSLDRDSSHDLHLTPDGITADRDNVMLPVEELHWHIGEATVWLRGGAVTVDCVSSKGMPTQLVFKPAGNYVSETCDGKWLTSNGALMIDLDADTGKLLLN